MHTRRLITCSLVLCLSILSAGLTACAGSGPDTTTGWDNQNYRETQAPPPQVVDAPPAPTRISLPAD